MAFKDIWKPLIENESELEVKPINDMADAIIELEKTAGNGSSITVDTEMSDNSSNPVENKVIKAYVDEEIKKSLGEISTALDELHTYAQSLVNGGVTV